VSTAATFVLPGNVDDRRLPSGGNTYDRRMCDVLATEVRAVGIDGNWPWPDVPARVDLAMLLAGLPDGATVLLDGLVACGVPDVVVPQARRLRVVVLVHLPLGDENGLDPAVAAALDARERETLHAASAVVATSPWAACRLIEHHGIAASRVHAVPPGTDPAPLAPGTDGRSRLLCVASVTPRKGQDLLAEALAGVADLPWSCECVGPLGRNPGYVERVRALIEQRGLAGRMILAGPRTGHELETAYAMADLVVLPSRAETFGMVVTEALARGIPVLATAVGALPETLGQAPDGSVPGILAPAGDTQALAAALRAYLTGSGLRGRLRQSARQCRIALTGWDSAGARLADVLAGLRREARWPS
jgi:glycosyltransferase involved in cell wall biosynthesis